MVDHHLFVILGGTGDLAGRKLLPSLHRLITENDIGDKCTILSAATTEMDDAEYRQWARAALRESGVDDGSLEAWNDDNVFYLPITRDPGTYKTLRARIEQIEKDRGLPGNRAFYLALPPAAFAPTIIGLGEAGLNDGPGWTKLVIEKPIGTDLETALALNETVHAHFDESQVYRIDHYLGKETVQNLLNFRFANPMFESIWNRDRIDSVEITVAEDLGIGTRAAYYDKTGALRDMVQNHLTQLLALIAMEPPNSFDAERVRNEKVKVVEAIASIDTANVVFGQYGPGSIDGEEVVGYCEEDGVDPDSKTPTFVGIKAYVNTWRWEGVPFVLRTGKRLPKRLTQIALTFHRPALCFFHGEADTCQVQPNTLLITLQPDEGFSLAFNVKSPDHEDQLDAQALHFSYGEAYRRLPDAYQTLILDVLQGDQTLFVRGDEVEASWKLYEPLLSYRPEPHPYAAGTWGPSALNQGIALSGSAWMDR
ncbi:MAG: glucose-6-phosphate dehydrogenase [Actinomycetota bacterium]|nr:glucose-6-phosphate dehydrogenase [Actinomycetota bacterium]